MLSTFSVDSSVSPHSSHSVNSIPFLWSPLTSLHLPLLSASNLSLNFISSLSDDVHLFKTPLGHHFKSSVILTSFLSRPQTNGQVHDVVYCILCCYFSYCLVCVCIVNHVVQVTVCFELTAMKYVLEFQPHGGKCVYGGSCYETRVHIQHSVPCMLSNLDNEYVKRLVGWLGTYSLTHAINYSSGPQPRFIMNLVIY